MLTCKQFLAELTDFLDEKTGGEIRIRLDRHLSECPNCWVVCDTTKKTLRFYRGMKSCTVPEDVQSRLMAAMERKMASGGPSKQE